VRHSSQKWFKLYTPPYLRNFVFAAAAYAFYCSSRLTSYQYNCTQHSSIRPEEDYKLDDAGGPVFISSSSIVLYNMCVLCLHVSFLKHDRDIPCYYNKWKFCYKCFPSRFKTAQQASPFTSGNSVCLRKQSVEIKCKLCMSNV
jgi:hypothetical protein